MSDNKETDDAGQPITLREGIVHLISGNYASVEGPLAEKCTTELFRCFGKDIDQETGIVLEAIDAKTMSAATESCAFVHSQIMMLVVLNRARKLALAERNKTVGSVYAVDPQQAQASDVINFKSQMVEADLESLKLSALAMIPIQEGAKDNAFAKRMRAIANEYRVPVISKMADYQGARK